MAEKDSVAHAPPIPAAAELDQRGSSPTVPTFAAIYHEYFDFVWASARRLGVSADAMDDVVQEVFIVIHARLHTLQQPGSLRSWIYGVVRRTVSGHRRARRFQETSGAEFVDIGKTLAPFPPTPLELTEQGARVALLSSILAELDEAKREVFVLAEIEEMSVPEIAEALEIPLNTAYSRLRAARIAFEAGLARRAARSKGELP